MTKPIDEKKIVANDKDRWLKILADNGLVVAAVTLLAYLIKFISDYSYGTYFRIPTEYMSFSLPSLFPTILVATGAAAYLIYMTGVNIHIKRDMNTQDNIWNTAIILMWISIFCYLIAPTMIRYYALWILLMAFVIVRHYLIPAVSHRDLKKYPARLRAHAESLEKKHLSDTIADYLWDFSMYRYTAIVLGIMGLLTLTALYSYRQASIQKDFYTLNGDPRSLVVRILDDKILVVKTDEKNKLTNELMIVNYDKEPLNLVKKRLGVMRNK